jgi:2-polyprenyl-6-hydroxyphenyl methylase / 3-demethylubiquinone-9 3-methyltransferase
MSSDSVSASPIAAPNADPAELEKFSGLAHRWWDRLGDFRPLHDINPVRLEWIDAVVSLKGKRVLDVGCGGGILAESMALKGAQVTGIDLADKALAVARLHSMESGVAVDYQLISTEDLAQTSAGAFDVVTCMEMLEHVPSPASVVAACAALVKPGGTVFFSTINRNLKAYALAVVGAEYVLRLLPRGTHEYAKFITPAELARHCRDASLNVNDIKGMQYNPFTHVATLSTDASVNYAICATRAAA